MIFPFLTNSRIRKIAIFSRLHYQIWKFFVHRWSACKDGSNDTHINGFGQVNSILSATFQKSNMFHNSRKNGNFFSNLRSLWYFCMIIQMKKKFFWKFSFFHALYQIWKFCGFCQFSPPTHVSRISNSVCRGYFWCLTRI